ncbi:hypothetical protein L1049_019088 [Liquidambar formosana]|uniref:Uncharacterized protein n=1 Tax=Liquidambar formosana TaxID=63359 RepID=A0AAP0RAY5_LIQFO
MATFNGNKVVVRREARFGGGPPMMEMPWGCLAGWGKVGDGLGLRLSRLVEEAQVECTGCGLGVYSEGVVRIKGLGWIFCRRSKEVHVRVVFEDNGGSRLWRLGYNMTERWERKDIGSSKKWDGDRPRGLGRGPYGGGSRGPPVASIEQEMEL